MATGRETMEINLSQGAVVVNGLRNRTSVLTVDNGLARTLAPSILALIFASAPLATAKWERSPNRSTELAVLSGDDHRARV